MNGGQNVPAPVLVLVRCMSQITVKSILALLHLHEKEAMRDRKDILTKTPRTTKKHDTNLEISGAPWLLFPSPRCRAQWVDISEEAEESHHIQQLVGRCSSWCPPHQHLPTGGFWTPLNPYKAIYRHLLEGPGMCFPTSPNAADRHLVTGPSPWSRIASRV